MVKRSLKTRIIISFLSIIGLLAVSIALLGIYVIERDIIERARDKVRNDLNAARMVYQSEIDRIGDALALVDFDEETAELRDKMRLDYLQVVSRNEIETIESKIVLSAFQSGKGVGDTRVISPNELPKLNRGLIDRAQIEIEPTERARPTNKTVVQSAMAKEYALPIETVNGQVTKVAYGGRIVNRDFEFVDRIQYLVYGDRLYDGKPVGTVTIFLGDVRISTNVRDKAGQRAIGTRISEEVYHQVVEQGESWLDRAYVVGDAYKAAYEPIRDIEGRIIGILYVGMLEAPFRDISRNLLLAFLAIVGSATALAVILSFVLAGGISRPLTNMLDATKKLSGGEFDYEVQTNTSVEELDTLAKSFNEMVVRLDDREKSLREANQKLTASNKSYVDLIGFVSHELKGILASAVINAYSVRDGLLGMVNFKQRKALDSVTRNLDYLDATVKKFLNLGRIERGDLSVHKMPLKIKETFDTSIESLSMVAKKQNKAVVNNIDPDLEVNADADLILIVANNLVSNAIKYSIEGGRIEANSQVINGKAAIAVYNDSTPINEQQKEKLFRKFSRLDCPETKRVKGTGLGLYITKQIIERHGGTIRVEPQEKGNTFIFEIERDT